MENRYLLAYLKEYYNDPRMDRILDYFKVDFDYLLYAYGNQFSPNNNIENNIQNKKEGPKELFLKPYKYISTSLKHIVYMMYSKCVLRSSFKKLPNCGTNRHVLFIEPISIALKKEFANSGIKAISIIEYNNDNYPQIKALFEWYKQIRELPFNERLHIERYDCIDGFIYDIQSIFKDFDGLFVGNEEYFLCKLFIDAFKNIGIPTYNWSHGLDSSIGIERRVDYRLVWGEGVKNNLIKYGDDADSIIVSGNIKYIKISNHSSLRNSLDDVLVFTSATIANIQHTWDYNLFPHWDRSLLITYIYSIEKVLKELGVKHARLRPHPINNYSWVAQYIDNSFYEIDYLPLEKSLDKATLAIGPTSSTFVEALSKGVNYLVYEPSENGNNLINVGLRPPFDGSDSNLKVSQDEEQLKELIKTNYSCDSNFLSKYIVPFNIDSFINTLGKK